jgi:predicted RNase H-like HicB family nuclease
MLMKKGLPRNIAYSVFYEQAPEGGYVAFVPTLPGCHTQGETLEAVALNIESLFAHGEAIPDEGRSFQGRVTIPVSVPA